MNLNQNEVRKEFEKVYPRPPMVVWTDNDYYVLAVKNPTNEMLGYLDEYQTRYEGYRAGVTAAANVVGELAARMDKEIWNDGADVLRYAEFIIRGNQAKSEQTHE